MSLEDDKKGIVNELYSHRSKIENIIVEIETLLKIHFPEEYSIAYQHWLPQIKTGLRDNTRFLPRGEYSMDYTLNRLIDKMLEENEKGVSRYIK